MRDVVAKCQASTQPIPPVADTLSVRVASMMLLQRLNAGNQAPTGDAAVQQRDAIAALLARYAPIFGRKLWITELVWLPDEVRRGGTFLDGGTSVVYASTSWVDLRIAFQDFNRAALRIISDSEGIKAVLQA